MNTKFFSNNGSKLIKAENIPAEASALAYKIMTSGDVLITYRKTDRAAKMAYTKTQRESNGQYKSYGWATIDNNDRTYGIVL